MSSIRTNFHRVLHPKEAARKFLNDQMKSNRSVFWDKNAHGISFCCGRDWETEARRYPDRFFLIANDLDLDEVFRNYEDDE